MGDAGVVELGQRKTVISSHSYLSKSGSQEQTPPGEGMLSINQAEKLVSRAVGSSFHAAFSEFCRRRILQEVFPSRQASLELAPKPSITEILSSPVKTIDELETALPQTLNHFDAKGIQTAIHWLSELNPHQLPKCLRQASKDIKEFCQAKRDRLVSTLAVSLVGLVDTWPELNNPQTLVMSEVRLQPKTRDLERLAELIANPLQTNFILPQQSKSKHKLVSFNPQRALRPGVKRPGSLEDYLYSVLVQHQSPLTNFKSLTDKVAEKDLASLMLSQTEADFINHFQPLVNQRKITPDELETLIALRVLSRAKVQIEFFLGGQTSKKISKTTLNELLRVFPLTKSLNQEEFNDLLARLSKETARILAPINMSADIFVLEMPQASPKFTSLKEYVAKQYQTNKQPAFFQNMKFLKLLEDCAKEGLKIRLGDIKTSDGPIPEKDFKREHSRELAFYNLVLFQAVAAYCQINQPERLSVFEVLNHPLVKALQENFLIYFGQEGSEQKIKPQLGLRTAFRNSGGKKLRHHFVKLYHQIIDSMQIRYLKNLSGFTASEDD